MHEVINITTTTQTYIANGVLTHNKAACPGVTALPNIYVDMYCTFETNYVPAFPFYVTITLSVSSVNCSYVVLQSPSTYTITSSPYPSFFYRTVSLQPRMAAGADLTYTLHAGITDSSSKKANNNYPTAPTPPANSYTRPILYCLTPDTLIETYFGKQLLLRDVKVGDELLSINRDTMEFEKTTVTSKSTEFVEELYIINNERLKCSGGHQHVVKRDNKWTVLGTEYLVVGDIMLNSDRKEFKIDKIDIIK